MTDLRKGVGVVVEKCTRELDVETIAAHAISDQERAVEDKDEVVPPLKKVEGRDCHDAR